MANQWFRMYHEFATDPKIQMLSEVVQRRYIMILCLRCSNVTVTLHDEEVAFQLRISNDEWLDTKRVLLEKSLINDDNTPTNWDKRQYTSDSSAERVRRHRERIRNTVKQTCNVTVTPPDTDTDTDTDTEEDISEHTVPDDVHDQPAPEKKIKVPFKKILDKYHECLPELPRIEELSEKRKGYIRQRWVENLPDMTNWENFFDYVRQSDFLMGRIEPAPGRKIFRPNLEWLTKQSNYINILEGKYHDG